MAQLMLKPMLWVEHDARNKAGGITRMNLQ